jgi:hypothetical protein
MIILKPVKFLKEMGKSYGNAGIVAISMKEKKPLKCARHACTHNPISKLRKPIIKIQHIYNQ